MQEILRRLKQLGQVEVFLFGDETLLREPVHEWRTCDYFLPIFSTGFPMDKAMAYCELRRPCVINDLGMQQVLRDRLEINEVLERLGVPHKTRFALRADAGDYDRVIECPDYIEYRGDRLYKPFVEKPVDADDHNVRVYYPQSMGGGMRRMFRKVNDRCSEYLADENEIRRDGTYLYEEFLPPDAGLDIKVYALGRDYIHAEARKAPTVDGRVERLPSGLESRRVVHLTSEEREMVQRVASEFQQGVCGIDLLRSGGRPYILDVNGWSFVKGYAEFYDACAAHLAKLMGLPSAAIAATAAASTSSSGVVPCKRTSPYTLVSSPTTVGGGGEKDKLCDAALAVPLRS